MNAEMTASEAYQIIHQLARMTAVNADVGDKRDEALIVLKKLTKPKSNRE